MGDYPFSTKSLHSQIVFVLQPVFVPITDFCGSVKNHLVGVGPVDEGWDDTQYFSDAFELEGVEAAEGRFWDFDAVESEDKSAADYCIKD